MNDSIDAARVLLDNKVPINLVDKNRDTILHKAASVKNLAFVKLFVDRLTKTKDTSLDVNALNAQNKTALNLLIDAAGITEKSEDEDAKMEVEQNTKKTSTEHKDRMDPIAFE